MEIPDGWEIAEEDRPLKESEYFFPNPDESEKRNNGLGIVGRTPADIRKIVFSYKDAVFLKPKITDTSYGNLLIPDGHELVTDEDYICKTNDIFSTDINFHSYNKISGYSGATWGHLKQSGAKALIRVKQKSLSPEEKRKLQIKKSQDFVKKYINNPNFEDFQKFESAFQREDNFGL